MHGLEQLLPLATAHVGEQPLLGLAASVHLVAQGHQALEVGEELALVALHQGAQRALDPGVVRRARLEVLIRLDELGTPGSERLEPELVPRERVDLGARLQVEQGVAQGHQVHVDVAVALVAVVTRQGVEDEEDGPDGEGEQGHEEAEAPEQPA